MSENKNTIDDLFKNVETDFDIESPHLGHQDRFLKKLNTQNTMVSNNKRNLWKPFIGIAASIALLNSIFIFVSKQNNKIDLASISPEMAQTETIFTNSLTKELEDLNSEYIPEYQEIIVDALFDIKILEEDYNQLIIGLKEQPKDKLILDAMILNFQSRIDVLQETKEKIEDLKKEINQNSII